MLDWLVNWPHNVWTYLFRDPYAGDLLTALGLALLAAEGFRSGIMWIYRWFTGKDKVAGDGWFRLLLTVSGWLCAGVGVSFIWGKENYGIGLVIACLLAGVIIAGIVMGFGVWGAHPRWGFLRRRSTEDDNPQESPSA